MDWIVTNISNQIHRDSFDPRFVNDFQDRSRKFICTKGTFKLTESATLSSGSAKTRLAMSLSNGSLSGPIASPSNRKSSKILHKISDSDIVFSEIYNSQTPKQIEIPELCYKTSIGNSKNQKFLNNNPEILDDINKLKPISKSKILKIDNDPVEKIREVQSEKAEILKKYLNYLNFVDQKTNFNKSKMEKKFTKTNAKNAQDDTESSFETKLPFFLEKNKSVIFTKGLNNLEIQHSVNKLKQSSIDQESRSPKCLTEVNQKNPDNISKSSKSFSKGFELYHNQKNIQSKGLPDTLIKDIIFNLNELALIKTNETQFIETLEKLTVKNLKIMKLILPKNHKFHDSDNIKLEKRLKAVEVLDGNPTKSLLPKILTNENLIIDKNTYQQLEEFNSNLEKYNIENKAEALKNLEECLIKIASVTNQDKNLIKKPRHKNSLSESVETGYDSREHYFSQAKFVNYPILNILKNFEDQYGEMRLVKRKNIAHTKAINDLTNKWIQ